MRPPYLAPRRNMVHFGAIETNMVPRGVRQCDETSLAPLTSATDLSLTRESVLKPLLGRSVPNHNSIMQVVNETNPRASLAKDHSPSGARGSCTGYYIADALESAYAYESDPCPPRIVNRAE
jgi:hypothetical protein